MLLPFLPSISHLVSSGVAASASARQSAALAKQMAKANSRRCPSRDRRWNLSMENPFAPQNETLGDHNVCGYLQGNQIIPKLSRWKGSSFHNNNAHRAPRECETWDVRLGLL